MNSRKTFWHRCISTLVAVGSALPVFAADNYTLGPDSMRQPGVPKGEVIHFDWTNSTVYPGTLREGWIYVPKQYDAGKPAGLMVFQDGHAYVNETGQQRVPVVFDNLIHRGEMPVTIGIFLNPGHRGTNMPAAGWGDRNNRSFEYDSLGDLYAKFLCDEVVPHFAKSYNISTDPKMRAICGMSSGAICAFTVAWERPVQFGKVLSQIGSFVNIRGGHVYPAWIRKTERKPIRVFLQDGSNDLNNLHGDWPLANQTMFSALSFAGYDVKFVFGDGAHNGKHGGAILPESLKWLWRPETSAPSPSTNNWRGDEALNKVLADGGKPGDWELVGENYGFTDAACGDAEGNFYFSDLPKAVLYKVGLDGKPVVWLEGGPKISGMKFGPDGRLYAATQGSGADNKKKIVAIDPVTKAITELATDVNPNDLVVSKSGWVYFTDTGAGQVLRVPIRTEKMSRPRPVAGGIVKPNGIGLSPTEDFLYVSEYGGTNGWSYVLAPDGELRSGERYLTLQSPVGKADSGGDGMIVDAEGRPFITSHLGIQMFDWTGRMGGIIAKPTEKGCVSCAFAGPGRSWLYACASDKVFRRRTLTKAAP